MAYRIRYAGGRYIYKRKQTVKSWLAGILLCGALLLPVLLRGVEHTAVRAALVEQCRQVLIEAGYHGQDHR